MTLSQHPDERLVSSDPVVKFETREWLANALATLRLDPAEIDIADYVADLRSTVETLRQQLTEAHDGHTKLGMQLTSARAEIDQGRSQLTEAQADRDRLVAALQEISEGKGRFSRDHRTHASNCIGDMKQLALDAIAALASSSEKPNG